MWIKKVLNRLREGIQASRSIEKIKQSSKTLIFAPFHGTPVPVVVRELTQAQVMACGDFSMIETFKDKISRPEKMDFVRILEYADRHHDICKKAILYPTYDDIIKAAGAGSLGDTKREAKELRKKLEEMPLGSEREALEKEIDSLLIWTDLILPDDFTAAIVSYSLGIEKSDIKDLTEEILHKAAILAERGHDNPADHVSGIFTDYMRDDINSRAWVILAEKRRDKNGSKT